MNRMKGIKILLVDDEPAILDFWQWDLKMKALKSRPRLTEWQQWTSQNISAACGHPGCDDARNGWTGSIENDEKTAIPPLLCLRQRMRWGSGKSADRGRWWLYDQTLQLWRVAGAYLCKNSGSLPNLFEEVALGPFRIDDRRREIRYQEEVLKLSATEYESLKFWCWITALCSVKRGFWIKYGAMTFTGRKYCRSVHPFLTGKIEWQNAWSDPNGTGRGLSGGYWMKNDSKRFAFSFYSARCAFLFFYWCL